MPTEIIVAAFVLVGVIFTGIMSFMAGSSKTKYDVSEHAKDIEELKSKECPCEIVKELKTQSVIQDKELANGRVLFAKIDKDLEYIKKILEKGQK